MRYPLKNLVFERVKARQNITDVDLLNELSKDGQELSIRDLNRVLLQLEIAGLVSVRWVGKDRRRIEVVERPSAHVEQ